MHRRPRWHWFVILLALGLSVGYSAHPADKENKEEPGLPQRPLTREDCDKLARLTPEQLRRQLGPPLHVNRQILSHRYLEQWLYEQPYLVRVEVDYVRGRKAYLLSVQPLMPPKP